ncbi:MAG: hypothetical protein QOK44_4231, partial [Betaproteobacteria bacterium]|nr:hypothetical protein [Betaproteobacteria bacterium]
LEALLPPGEAVNERGEPKVLPVTRSFGCAALGSMRWSNRQRAEGWEVTEGKLGFPLFVYLPASRCEGNPGFPLFAIVFRRKNRPLRGLFFLDPRNVWHFGKCAPQARRPRIADLGKIRVAVISEAPSQRNATCVALVGQQIDG